MRVPPASTGIGGQAHRKLGGRITADDFNFDETFQIAELEAPGPTSTEKLHYMRPLARRLGLPEGEPRDITNPAPRNREHEKGKPFMKNKPRSAVAGGGFQA